MKRFYQFVCLLASCTSASTLAYAAPLSQPTLLVDVDHRSAVSLNGDWHFIIDPYSAGLSNFQGDILDKGFFENREVPPGSNDLVEYSFAKSPTLKVPGDWNTQRDDLHYYEGLLWYQRDFDFTPKADTRIFFHVGAANYKSNVFVNGKHICDHEGGFAPFDCEVTSVLHPGKNFAVIAVNNTRITDGIPTVKTDWFNYGGLTRDVSLVAVPKSYIDDYDLHLSRSDRKTVEGYVHVVDAAAGTKVKVLIDNPDSGTEAVVGADGRAAISFEPKNLTLWSPEHPKLYNVRLTSDGDAVTDQIGFRTIEVDGTKILLNGKPVVLHGINVHAEAPYRTGRVNTDAGVKTLFDWVQELGCNFVRLAHYPHDERMTREADRRGIMVWSEIPVYWGIRFEDPALLTKAEGQLSDMVRRDRNKASVILWSIANETRIGPARDAYLANLAAYAHQADPTRLITAALLVRGEGDTKIVDDPLGKSLDVLGTNEYVGWYEKTPEDIDKVTWKIAFDKPLIMSEWGGEGIGGKHGTEHDRWTEEYQASIYRHQIAMLNRIPQLRGTTPWLLMDFRSPVRLLPGYQDGFNRKGLIAPDGKKKEAFAVLERAYKDNALGKPE